MDPNVEQQQDPAQTQADANAAPETNPSLNTEEPKEKKPFNLVEELQKPYVVGIKPEFVLPIDRNKRNESEQSEPKQGVTYKTKRNRADVGVKKRAEYKILCREVAQGRECPYKDSCKFDHDVQAFFANRQPDISPMCPVWERHGYCPMGLNCRWAGSHTSSDLKPVAKPTEEQTPIIEYNEIGNLLQTLRKKTYLFTTSDSPVSSTNPPSTEPAESNPPSTEPAEPNPPSTEPAEPNPPSTEPAEPMEPTETPKPVGALGEAEVRPVDFRGKIYIAPLTTVGNLPFRRLCVEFGADITCSEMAITTNLLKGQVSEWALLRRHPCERVFGVQIATGRPDEARKTAELLRREFRCDFLDLNCGCPIDVLDKMGAGAALMGHPSKLRRILTGVLDGAETLPVVCKLRTGDRENSLEKFVGSLAALQGRRGNRVSALTIHGRTKVGRYTKLADWEYVEKCAALAKQSASDVQVIGNGDVFDHEMYYEHLQSGVLSGVMIGRGALIKPWICTEIKERRHWDISAGERLEIVKRFCDYGLEHWGSDEQGVDRTRRFLLEWLSFLCRYVPVGILERPQRINQRPFVYVGRSELETLLGSHNAKDWIKISEMFLGPVAEGFTFIPKHKSNAYVE